MSRIEQSRGMPYLKEHMFSSFGIAIDIDGVDDETLAGVWAR